VVEAGSAAGRSARRIAALAPVVLAFALLLAAAPARAATSQHVDCSASPVGADGSLANPWSSLADVDPVLTPGDEVLLRRGVTCAGGLSLSGDGTAAQPVHVGPYGAGTADPVISGTGEDALVLEDVSHAEVEGLELTNPGDGTGKRRGLRLLASGEVVAGDVVRDLHIHDVGGNLDKDFGGSGGIQVDSTGAGGRFADLHIAGNRIEDVSRSGIFIVGVASGTRPRAGQPWPEASTGVQVTGNRIDRIAGDGIVTLGTDRAVVSGNVVSRGNLAGRGIVDPQGMICNAGIWAFNANGTVIEHNEVFGMKFNGCDGTAFDVDYMQDGTVIQSNYSHDNEGGFLLLCTDSQPRTAQVRFNLSVDDRYMLNSSPCSEPAGSYDGIKIHNNTVVAPDPGFALLGGPSQALYGPPSLSFFDNIVAATGTARAFTCEPECRRNLFWNVPPAGTDYIEADPRFADPARRGTVDTPDGFKLMADSPALDAGAPLTEPAGTDYFGNPVNAAAPDIGFYQGAEAPTGSRPVLRGLRLHPRRLRAATGRGSSISYPRRRAGARLRLRLSDQADVTFRFVRARPGKDRGIRGRARIHGEAGVTSVGFTGRVHGKPLPPGRYRLRARARNASGVSKRTSVPFRILPRH
jgi:hypothetical protein